MLPALAIVGAQPCLAFAHKATAGQHGGPVADVNGHRVELVGAELQLSIYLSDENSNPTAVRGVSGRATIMQGGKTETVALVPKEPNKLIGLLSHALGPADRIIVTATLADRHGIQAQFVRN
jgi:hypothetical protein